MNDEDRASATKTKLPRWTLVVLAGSVAAVLALTVAVVVLLLARGTDDGGERASAASSEAKTFDAHGTFTLTDSDVFPYGNDCAGSGGYDDIHAGTQVVVRDSRGDTVGIGALGFGMYRPDESSCQYALDVEDVPKGRGPYTVEVSHRGEVAFKEGDAQHLVLTLG